MELKRGRPFSWDLKETLEGESKYTEPTQVRVEVEVSTRDTPNTVRHKDDMIKSLLVKWTYLGSSFFLC